MKYKVTITSQDLTGQEDTIVHENLSEEQLKLTIDYNKGKTILIEPMPEKKMVTVWFYVFERNGVIGTCSNYNKDSLLVHYKYKVKIGCKVSEIKSMEVEI